MASLRQSHSKPTGPGLVCCPRGNTQDSREPRAREGGDYVCSTYRLPTSRPWTETASTLLLAALNSALTLSTLPSTHSCYPPARDCAHSIRGTCSSATCGRSPSSGASSIHACSTAHALASPSDVSVPLDLSGTGRQSSVEIAAPHLSLVYVHGLSRCATDADHASGIIPALLPRADNQSIDQLCTLR